MCRKCRLHGSDARRVHLDDILSVENCIKETLFPAALPPHVTILSRARASGSPARCNMGNKRKLSNIFAASAFLCVFLVGTQQLSAQTVREPATSPVAVPQQTPAAIGTTEKTNDEGVAPIYGLQGVLIETLDGRVVSMQAADQKFNPASSIKLATAFVALHNLGQTIVSQLAFDDGTLTKPLARCTATFT